MRLLKLIEPLKTLMPSAPSAQLQTLDLNMNEHPEIPGLPERHEGPRLHCEAGGGHKARILHIPPDAPASTKPETNPT